MQRRVWARQPPERAALRSEQGETGVLRLKHMLRRVAIIVQRVRAGELQLAHIPDAAQYVDSLTKWISGRPLV